MRLPRLLAPLSFLATPALAGGGAVEVVVENVRSAEGQVMVQLCPKAQFLGKCAIGGKAPAHAGNVTVTLPAVPPGDWAAMAFHDKDASGALNRWLGIPREDFGFSRMQHLPLRPPRFSDAVFSHGAEDQKVFVKLNNYFG